MPEKKKAPTSLERFRGLPVTNPLPGDPDEDPSGPTGSQTRAARAQDTVTGPRLWPLRSFPPNGSGLESENNAHIETVRALKERGISGPVYIGDQKVMGQDIQLPRERGSAIPKPPVALHPTHAVANQLLQSIGQPPLTVEEFNALNK